MRIAPRVVVGLLVIAGWGLWRWSRSEVAPATPPARQGVVSAGRTDSVPAVSPVPPPPLERQNASVRLEVHLQRAGEKRGYHVLASADLPLRDNDKAHVHIETSVPGYIYLLWYDAEGIPKLLWPESDQEQKPARDVWSPELSADSSKQVWHLIGGDPGLEMILAGVSDHPLSAAEMSELQAMPVEFGIVGDDHRVASADDVVRGVIGKVVSSKSSVPSTESVLLVHLPSAALKELTAFGPQTGTDQESAPQPGPRRDFRRRLSEYFSTYAGLVVFHR